VFSVYNLITYGANSRKWAATLDLPPGRHEKTLFGVVVDYVNHTDDEISLKVRDVIHTDEAQSARLIP
jgi:hypothetical protein